MNPQEFCYWLQGYFEIDGKDPQALTAEQVGVIRNHLALVFHHSIDPAQGLTPEQESEAQAIHDGGPVPAWANQRPRIDGMRIRC